MSEGKIYVGDVGTVIEVDCGEDVSADPAPKMAVRKPNGVVVEWVAHVVNASIVRYVTQPGDQDVPGRYRVQPVVALPAWSGRGRTVWYRVYPKFG